jgi:hypothetical protein
MILIKYHMKFRLTITLLLFIGMAHGQNFEYPTLNVNGQDIDSFIPNGWVLLDSSKGDLNKDGNNDAVIILQRKDSVTMVVGLEDTVLTQPRILAILFKNPINKNFTLIEQNNSFILSHTDSNMDDPYESSTINKGIIEIRFRLFYNMGSWYITNSTYKFRYTKDQFVLIGADISSFDRATHDFDNYSYNFLTKKRTLTKGNDNTQYIKVSQKAQRIAPLKALKNMGKPFTWEIETGIYL